MRLMLEEARSNGECWAAKAARELVVGEARKHDHTKAQPFGLVHREHADPPSGHPPASIAQHVGSVRAPLFSIVIGSHRPCCARPLDTFGICVPTVVAHEAQVRNDQRWVAALKYFLCVGHPPEKRRCVGGGVEARQGSVVTLKGCLARPKSTKGEVGHLGSGVGCAKDGSREKEARHRLYFWKKGLEKCDVQLSIKF